MAMLMEKSLLKQMLFARLRRLEDWVDHIRSLDTPDNLRRAQAYRKRWIADQRRKCDTEPAYKLLVVDTVRALRNTTDLPERQRLVAKWMEELK